MLQSEKAGLRNAVDGFGSAVVVLRNALNAPSAETSSVEVYAEFSPAVQVAATTSSHLLASVAWTPAAAGDAGRLEQALQAVAGAQLPSFAAAFHAALQAEEALASAVGVDPGTLFPGS